MFIPQLDHCGSWLGNLTLTSVFFFTQGEHINIYLKKEFLYMTLGILKVTQFIFSLCGHQMKTTDKLLLKDN